MLKTNFYWFHNDALEKNNSLNDRYSEPGIYQINLIVRVNSYYQPSCYMFKFVTMPYKS